MMQKTDISIDLTNAIFELELKQTAQWDTVKQQLRLVHESIQPINLLKSTFEKATASPDLNSIVNTSIGLTAGYLSKKIFVGFSDSPIKKLLGTVLLFGVTNIVSRNPQIVNTLGSGLVQIIERLAGNNDET